MPQPSKKESDRKDRRLAQPSSKNRNHTCMAALILTSLLYFPWTAFSQEPPAIPPRVRTVAIKEFRQKRDAFMKNHPRSPLREEDREGFQGLDYFPIDLRYVFVGKIDRYRLNIHNSDYYATFPTNKGTNKRYIRYGKFTFQLDGVDHTLQLYKSILSDHLYVPFKDKTNGKETYELGRYIDAEIIPGYFTIIDFNMAYNPNCVFNENAVCPIPPEDNSLPLEIKAGEKR
jgi:uncharacterized protein (DUF1684 family)